MTALPSGFSSEVAHQMKNSPPIDDDFQGGPEGVCVTDSIRLPTPCESDQILIICGTYITGSYKVALFESFYCFPHQMQLSAGHVLLVANVLISLRNVPVTDEALIIGSKSGQ
ncbi:hypothetical protein BS47DRAFT_12432 [Hydnum rufescens UP504]|uniref:Uncharacterized protein n=1 Tax=Hydnum rufescens UP504 TaxID=1448309 RepID=A0A9P6BCF1_9AGAM|nr:hypothetical protein BS47DRAFT_12432 [Hydnum rufescens UP504]